MKAMRQVILYPDHEDGGWVAEVPSLPGCVACGDTRDAALVSVGEAIQAWIAAAPDMGWTLPDPSADVGVCHV